jgi:hypothetical protein
MSMFRDALRALLVTTLRCPRCPAANRPGATVIEIDATSTRAYCGVCTVEGPIASFQPKKET